MSDTNSCTHGEFVDECGFCDADAVRKKLAQAEADRDIYKRVIDGIGEFIKTGKVDPMLESKSTTFFAVRDKLNRLEEDLATVRENNDGLAALLHVDAQRVTIATAALNGLLASGNQIGAVANEAVSYADQLISELTRK